MNLHQIHPFESSYIPRRNVDIWLPPAYPQEVGQRYPVVYMHDGQNLFDPALSYAGVDWGVDPALQRLIASADFTPPIVVGIWNTDNRLGEYMPEKPLEDPKSRARVESFIRRFRGEHQFEVCSDAYLAFIVEELKPWVDDQFCTLPDQANTHIAGSSMGGLISLYAVCQYPGVFCGAGCVSPAWNFGRGVLVPYFGQRLPDPAHHRLYFDMGSKETPLPWVNWGLLKAQARMDTFCREAGYTDQKSLLTLTFPGGKHHESAWRERVEGMIRFLI
ncbi:MAG: alpha/beta hydrolase [Anaerolineales bacterium]|nr:alpha/beta hydrolase [Anaerolineales bacterium]